MSVTRQRTWYLLVNSSKATKTGLAVLELQNKLPKARVVYCSATGKKRVTFILIEFMFVDDNDSSLFFQKVVES